MKKVILFLLIAIISGAILSLAQPPEDEATDDVAENAPGQCRPSMLSLTRKT